MKSRLIKFKKIFIAGLSISFGLSIGLTAGLVSNHSDKISQTQEISNNNSDLFGQKTFNSFEKNQNKIISNNDLKKEFLTQLDFYKTTPNLFFDKDTKNKESKNLLNLKSETVENKNLPSSQEINSYVSKKIIEYQKDYLNGNFDLNTVLDNAKKSGWDQQKIVSEINDYQDKLIPNKQSFENNNQIKTYGLALHASYGDKTFGDTIDKITSVLTGLAVTSAVASVAAAGFWAAAWWFGITIPWAIAATSLAVTLTANTIGVAILKDKIQAPINMGYVTRSTKINNIDSLVNTVNRSTFDYIDDFVSVIEKIVEYRHTFKTAIEIISLVTSVSSFAVPSATLLQKIINTLIKYLATTIIYSLIFSALKSAMALVKEKFNL